MSQNLQYPSNPDTSLESFLITKEDVQILRFGRTISQAECVPLNYTKIAKEGLVSIKYTPVRELIQISDAITNDDINDEVGLESQAVNQTNLIFKAFYIWEDKYSKTTAQNLYTGFEAAMGVVTEISSSIVKDFYTKPEEPESFGIYRIVTKIKINWLTPIGSTYA